MTTLDRTDYGISGTSRWNRVISATGQMAMSETVDVTLSIVAQGPRLDDEILAAVSEGGGAAGVRAFRELRSRVPAGVDWTLLNRVGSRLVRDENLAGAIELLQLNAAEYPEVASAHVTLGQVLRMAERPAEAAESFRRALAVEPDHEFARAQLDELNE